jgi:hypothetical protein
LDCKSPIDYHEHFSAKSIDESKASVYFTPNDDGHLSPQSQSSQLSPIHINYINDEGAAGKCNEHARGSCHAMAMRSFPSTSSRPHHSSTQRNSFQLPSDFVYLDEADEGNFIIPDQIYADQPKEDRFHCIQIDDAQIDILMDAEGSLSSLSSASEYNRERERQKSNFSVENEAFLMHEIMDESTGARRKIPHHLSMLAASKSSQCAKKEHFEGD